MKTRLKILLLLVLFVFSVYTVTQSSGQVVLTGSNVTVSYTGWIRNHTFNTNTVNFIVGEEEVIKGLESGVLGMHLGEVKNITIPSTLAYGSYDEELIYGVPIEFFESNNVSLPYIGEEVMINDLEGLVINVTDEYVVVDTNHPLAGEELNMTIKVLSIK